MIGNTRAKWKSFLCNSEEGCLRLQQTLQNTSEQRSHSLQADINGTGFEDFHAGTNEPATAAAAAMRTR